MIRAFNTLCFVTMVALFVGLYHIRYSAEGEARAVRSIDAEILSAEARRDTLHAEWSSLNDPRRLQKLAAEHLSLVIVDAFQIIDMRPDDARRPLPAMMQEVSP